MKCEEDEFETCSNCPADCGTCETIGCFEIVTCVLGGCIDLGGGFPPDISLTCFANCVAKGCADVQFFVDQFVNCALGAIPECGGDFQCFQEVCQEEFTACLAADCP